MVEEQHVVFRPGLNVITGESGAGKSVLVEALGQVVHVCLLHDRNTNRLPHNSDEIDGPTMVGEYTFLANLHWKVASFKFRP